LLAIIDAWKKLKEAIGEKLRRFVKMGSD